MPTTKPGFYSATGEIETIYRKHHLVPTWESRSTPGTELSVLTQPMGQVGIQICRDMDYPESGPALCENKQDCFWCLPGTRGLPSMPSFHGHMSVMRGVEGGFSMVRDAKNGLLTASDDRGRILAEEPTRTDGALVTMVARVPLRHDSTLYQRSGDWFAWVDLLALLALWQINKRRRPGALGITPHRQCTESSLEAREPHSRIAPVITLLGGYGLRVYYDAPNFRQI